MKVKFLPQEQEFEIRPGQSVMDLAHEKGIYIKSICNGLPSCAECRVRVVDGEANVLPPSAKELNLIGNGYFLDQRRLSCQLMCFGDVTIDLGEQIEKEKQAPRRLLGNRKIEASNAISGNIIEQDAELKQMMTLAAQRPAEERSSDRAGQQEQVSAAPKNALRGRDSNRPSSRSHNRPNSRDNRPSNQERQGKQDRKKSFRYRPGQGQK